jgi:hypothetical protein
MTIESRQTEVCAVTLSPELLGQAKTAGAALAEAERQALLARAEYHTGVRRLHLAGGSLREIAQALSISHQRVQQIVSGAGGTWWRRIWRTRTIRPDAVCTWCGRPPSEVAKLVAGPNVFICDGCVASAEQTATGRVGAGPFAPMQKSGVVVALPAVRRRRCAFCGKGPGKDRALATSPAGHVCSDCVRVCREILDGRAT